MTEPIDVSSSVPASMSQNMATPTDEPITWDSGNTCIGPRHFCASSI